MPQIKEVTTYTFDELHFSDQEKVIERYLQDGHPHHDWWDYTRDMFCEAGKMIGIEVYEDNFWFDLSHYTITVKADYSYTRGGAKAVRDEFPLDKELHRIADYLQDMQRPYFYGISAQLRSGRGFGGEYQKVTVFDRDGYEAKEEVQDEFEEVLTDFTHWILTKLQKEWDYLTSEEYIREEIEENEMRFTENGETCTH